MGTVAFAVSERVPQRYIYQSADKRQGEIFAAFCIMVIDKIHCKFIIKLYKRFI